jgi:heme/copper-type cytochrome/quinol oxidase subunit 2
MVMKSTSILTLIVILFIAGIGMGYVVGFSGGAKVTSSVSTPTTTTAQNNTEPFVLTLVITTENTYNATTGAQPAYYILTANGLQSAANIALPVNRLIKLVIINYDNGSANLTNVQDTNVSGTQNNIETVVNNANVNSSQGASAINVKGGQNVSSINSTDVAHTFTIPSLNVNLPIPPSSTVTTYFTLNQTGTFSWFCMTECGFGPTGLKGAMDTPGWMMGGLTVS